jgi:hypothetical protein
MVIQSVDTLRGLPIYQIIPSTWNDRPPLLSRTNGKNGKVLSETSTLLKGMLRNGIPPALRSAVLLSNTVEAVHPHQDPSYWHEYRTLAKVRALDHAYECLLQKILLPSTTTSNNENGSNSQEQPLETLPVKNSNPVAKEYNDTWSSMAIPSFGRDKKDVILEKITGVTESGRLAFQRVLIALEQILGTEYSPLIPVLTAILLTNMSESYAFAVLREMGHAVTWFFPISRIEHAAWCRAFGDILSKLHGQTAEYLHDRGVLDVDGLAPLFQDFFVGLLPFQYVQRIMDIYTLEGSKVIFRFGVALLVLYKKESAEQLITISTADEWWQTLRIWAHSQRFDFELVVRKAYGVHGRGIRRQLRFPRRAILHRIIRMEEERIRSDASLDDNGQYQEPPARPLGLLVPAPVASEEEINAHLAQSVAVRQHLAQWLPLTLRLTNMTLIYSTNYHGRTLERFYSHVKNYKHTILLCEVLLPKTIAADTNHNDNKNALSNQEDDQTCIIGLFASQTWHPSTQVYG